MNNTINTKDLLNYICHLQSDKTMDLDESYLMFLDYKKIHNRKGTHEYYKDQVRRVINYLKNYHISYTNQIDNKIINRYIKDRLVTVKPVTVNKEIIALRVMLNWLLKQELISSINFTYEKLMETKTKIDRVSTKDIIKIVDHFDKDKCRFEEQNKLIFVLILTTGIRTNELVNIRNDNIDLKNKRILLDFTKNGKPRYIYIVDQVLPLIKMIKNNNIYLFNDENNKQLTQNAVKCFFRRLKTNLGIMTLSPHKLRHYYATNVYKKSLDIYLVSKLLGHCNTKTTEIYLDVDERDNQLKNNLYNPLNDLETQGPHRFLASPK